MCPSSCSTTVNKSICPAASELGFALSAPPDVCINSLSLIGVGSKNQPKPAASASSVILRPWVYPNTPGARLPMLKRTFLNADGSTPVCSHRASAADTIDPICGVDVNVTPPGDP